MNKTKLKRLKYEALRAYRFRGHTIYRMKDSPDKKSAIGFCKECGRQVTVTCDPSPNGLEIMGEAIAVDCTPSLASQFLHELNTFLHESRIIGGMVEATRVEFPTRPCDTVGKIHFNIGGYNYTLKLLSKEE